MWWWMAMLGWIWMIVFCGIHRRPHRVSGTPPFAIVGSSTWRFTSLMGDRQGEVRAWRDHS